MKLFSNARCIGTRRTGLCVSAAIAIIVSAVADAGPWDRGRSAIRAVKTTNVVHITNIPRPGQAIRQLVEERPLRTAVENLAGAIPGSGLAAKVGELHVIERFDDTLSMVREMQAGYEDFVGGERCGATCATFREELKHMLEGYLQLVESTPLLQRAGQLSGQIRRISGLVDHLPPRAVYLMWQAAGSGIREFSEFSNQIRQVLARLPRMDDSFDLASAVSSTGSVVANSPFCVWIEEDEERNEAIVELVQARLKTTAATVKFVGDIIPDVSVGGGVGATAGAAVANALAKADIKVKSTDVPKIVLKIVAFVVERIDMAVTNNRAACVVASNL